MTALANLFGLGSDDVRRQAGPIDVLIGINYSRFLVGETKVKGNSSRKEEPTWLGDIWFQRRRFNAANQTTVHCSPCPTVDMTDFWKTESMGVSIAPCTCEGVKLSAQEREELKLIEESCQLQGNEWIIKYPWKRSPSILPNNYVQVRKKLESLERRLMKDPENASATTITSMRWKQCNLQGSCPQRN